jgi:hypothetical protein
VHRLGQQVGHERRRQRDRVRRQRVAANPAQRPDGVRDEHPDRDAAGGDEEELPDGRGGGEPVAAGGGDGHRQDGQRGGVVEQALALDQRDQPRGQPDPAADGERGDRVGGCDRGAERDPGRERRPGDEQLEADPDHQRGGGHEEHREADHGAQVAADRGQRAVQRGAVEQRGQHQGEHQLGVELDVRAGQVGVRDAGQRQQRRGRQPGAVGHPAHRHDDRDRAQDQQQQGLHVHPDILPDRGRRGRVARR